jgi:hypothetical protein
MLLSQQFKTLEGALKRAAFERAHCNGRFHYKAVRCLDGVPDANEMDLDILRRRMRYTWRIEKTPRRFGHGQS